jgi:hypothetical protein
MCLEIGSILLIKPHWGLTNKMNTNETLERQVIDLIAADRIFVATSSMDNKLKRMRPKLARAVDLEGTRYSGERVFAYVQDEEGSKARGMKYAIEEFSRRHPNSGQELKGLVAEQRTLTEPTLYFGMQEGRRLTADDYLGVMANLGFTEAQSRALYAPLLDTSRSLTKKRDETRSIVLGSTL